MQGMYLNVDGNDKLKSCYRHNTSGDLFAIETDDKGNVLSTCGPLANEYY